MKMNQSVSLMTFNALWHRGPENEKHPWSERMKITENVILKYEPDIICFQELLVKQINDLFPSSVIPRGRGESLSQYAVTGPFDKNGNLSSRGNSGNQGIHIFYNKEKFELKLKNSRFRTPGINNFRRPTVWAHFRTKKHSNKELLIFNCHLDWNSPKAERSKVAEMLWDETQKRIEETELPAFILGDFNSSRNEQTWEILTGRNGDNEGFADAQVIMALNNGVINSEIAESGAKIDETIKMHTRLKTTCHDFRGIEQTEFLEYIDWILYMVAKAEIVHFEIVEYNEDGLYPSDHYPVFAEFLI